MSQVGFAKDLDSLFFSGLTFITGVTIGQATKVVGKSVRSGVTVLLPRGGEGMLEPCYAGMHTLNGNGEVTGSYQIKDWGFVNMVRRSGFLSLSVREDAWNTFLSWL